MHIERRKEIGYDKSEWNSNLLVFMGRSCEPPEISKNKGDSEADIPLANMFR